jgi:hypothetical protein
MNMMNIVQLLERIEGTNVPQPDLIWASDLIWYADVGFWLVAMSACILVLLAIAPLTWSWFARNFNMNKLKTLILGSKAQANLMGNTPINQTFAH